MLEKLKFPFWGVIVVIVLMISVEISTRMNAIKVKAESAPSQYLIDNEIENEEMGSTSEPGEYLRVIITPEQQSVLKGGNAQFTVVVLNTSNSVDLVDVNVSAPSVPDCNKTIGNLAANSNFTPYACSILNVQSSFVNEISVQGTNPINNRIDIASNSVLVDLLDLQSSIFLEPDSIPEPGGTVSFTVAVSNTGSTDFELNELSSPQFGDLTDSTNPAVLNTTCEFTPQPPVIIVGGKDFACSFLGIVTGQPSEFEVIITATGGQDSSGNLLEKSSKGIVQITDVPASLSVSVTPSVSSVLPPGGLVEFTAEVENTGLVDVISIETLNDSILGDLTNKGTCFLPKQIQPGEAFTCTYEREIIGGAGDVLTFVLTAEGVDDDLPPGQVLSIGQTVIDIIEPPVYSVFFPGLIIFIDEPNNNCSQVFPLNVNQTYHFMANDIFDLYEFNLIENGDVTINLTNFLPKIGQLIAYKDIGEGCANSTVLANNADESTQKVLSLGTLDAGRYFILVLNEGELNTQDPYQLEIILTDEVR